MYTFSGSTEPQHILPSLCNGLDVHQVLDPNVLGDGVAAPGAAAQGQGRLAMLEVVQVADTALRGGGIDQRYGRSSSCARDMRADLLLLGHSVHVERTRCDP